MRVMTAKRKSILDLCRTGLVRDLYAGKGTSLGIDSKTYPFASFAHARAHTHTDALLLVIFYILHFEKQD